MCPSVTSTALAGSSPPKNSQITASPTHHTHGRTAPFPRGNAKPSLSRQPPYKLYACMHARVPHKLPRCVIAPGAPAKLSRFRGLTCSQASCTPGITHGRRTKACYRCESRWLRCHSRQRTPLARCACPKLRVPPTASAASHSRRPGDNPSPVRTPCCRAHAPCHC